MHVLLRVKTDDNLPVFGINPGNASAVQPFEHSVCNLETDRFAKIRIDTVCVPFSSVKIYQLYFVAPLYAEIYDSNAVTDKNRIGMNPPILPAEQKAQCTIVACPACVFKYGNDSIG